MYNVDCSCEDLKFRMSDSSVPLDREVLRARRIYWKVPLNWLVNWNSIVNPPQFGVELNENPTMKVNVAGNSYCFLRCMKEEDYLKLLK